MDINDEPDELTEEEENKLREGYKINRQQLKTF
jgi:hypothetical protein